jgi:uncharacterized protein with NRDE domain
VLWPQDADRKYPSSRGYLLREYLPSKDTPSAFVHRQHMLGHECGAYNMLCGDVKAKELWHLSNRAGVAPTLLGRGFHAMSNGAMDDEWPKMLQGKQRLLPLLAGLDESGTKFKMLH